MNDPKPRKQAPKVTEEIDRDLANLNGQVQPNRAPAASNKAAAVEPSCDVQGRCSGPRP
ncbi:hypothetical protein FRC0191_02249 [Corynebacterium diphtheriae]|nr:hypothetical protein FRC0191_02249 [Corynebacterium diphtheriae]